MSSDPAWPAAAAAGPGGQWTAAPRDAQADAALAALVAAHAPPRDFVPLLGGRREAARYFAAAHGAANAAPVGPCIGCGATGDLPTTTAYRWAARFTDGIHFGWVDAVLLLVGRVGVSVKYSVVSFDTAHPTCARCGPRLRRARGLANVLNFIGLFTVLVAGTVLAMCVSAAFYFDRRAERLGWAEASAVTALITAAGGACLWWMRRLRVPPSLRYVSAKPFGFASAKLIRR
jgi:hypothetical protein